MELRNPYRKKVIELKTEVDKSMFAVSDFDIQEQKG